MVEISLRPRHGPQIIPTSGRAKIKSALNYVRHAKHAACRRAGLSALRFNFRGVGRSTGFSFGSVAALRVGAADPRVTALLAVGPPCETQNMDFLATVIKPKAFIAGAHDEFCPRLPDWAGRLPEPCRWWEIPGADHLFALQRRELEAVLAEAVAFLLDEGSHITELSL